MPPGDQQFRVDVFSILGGSWYGKWGKFSGGDSRDHQFSAVAVSAFSGQQWIEVKIGIHRNVGQALVATASLHGFLAIVTANWKGRTTKRWAALLFKKTNWEKTKNPPRGGLFVFRQASVRVHFPRPGKKEIISRNVQRCWHRRCRNRSNKDSHSPSESAPWLNLPRSRPWRTWHFSGKKPGSILPKLWTPFPKKALPCHFHGGGKICNYFWRCSRRKIWWC